MIRAWSEKPTGQLVEFSDILTRDARIVRLYGYVYDSKDREMTSNNRQEFMAETIFESLIALGNENTRPIKIVIDNAGGSIQAGFLIIQAIEHLRAKNIDVEMLVIGSSNSMASVILASGTQGKRYAMPRSIVHFHSAKLHLSGKETEAEKEQMTEHGRYLSLEIRRILSARTNIPEYWRSKSSDNTEPFSDEASRMKWIQKFLEGERYLSAEEALEAGAIDAVLKPGDPRLDAIFKLEERSAQ